MHDIVRFMVKVGSVIGRPTSSSDSRHRDAEVDHLNERIRQLEEVLAPSAAIPAEWKLTPSQSIVFRVLLAREMATDAAVMAALYGDRLDDPPEKKVVQVFLHHLRRKLQPFGITIETMWGQGYRLADRHEWRGRLSASPTGAHQ